jgi:hypothetical protein
VGSNIYVTERDVWYKIQTFSPCAGSTGYIVNRADNLLFVLQVRFKGRVLVYKGKGLVLILNGFEI